ncbi:MAG: ribonuclease HII [archaeon]
MRIAGVDEAGRGPALGPMVLAVAVIDSEKEHVLKEMGAKDSKVVPLEDRERMYPLLQNELEEFATFHLHAPEMDELMARESLNEIEALKIGYLLNNLKSKPDLVYVDSPDPVASNFAKRIHQYLSYKTKIVAEHKADVHYPVCSAASIIAKVERDREIQKIQAQFSEYGNIGSGYSHDERTITFIQKYIQKHDSLPECARKKWDTNVRLMNARWQTKLV